jgi:hypothetical protein
MLSLPTSEKIARQNKKLEPDRNSKKRDQAIGAMAPG